MHWKMGGADGLRMAVSVARTNGYVGIGWSGSAGGGMIPGVAVIGLVNADTYAPPGTARPPRTWLTRSRATG